MVRLDPAVADVRHERSVLVDVAGGLVVGAVAEAPAVEGNEEEGVHNQAHDVIETLALAECAVTALMRQNPYSREHEALDDRVGGPGNSARIGIRDVLNEGGCVAEDAEVEVVSHNVGHGADNGGLEAVRWNGIVDHFHGEVREFKDLAGLSDVLALFRGSGIGGAPRGSHDELALR